MSLQKPKPVHAASKRLCTAAGREVQVPWVSIHEWRKVEQRDWYTACYSKRSSTWALSLCVHKAVIHKHYKDVSLNCFLFRSSRIVMNFG